MISVIMVTEWRRQRVFRYFSLSIVLSFLIVVPFLPISSKWVRILTVANFFAIFAMSWDILAGYTGQISFGHAFFIGAAAYTSAMVNAYFSLPLWLTIPLGTLAAVVMGMVVAVPTLSLKGPYLALVTLLLPIVGLKLVLIFSSVTGGEMGLSSGIDPLNSASSYGIYQGINYYYSLGLMLGVAFFLILIAKSHIGSIFEAIRENEEAAESAGINTAKFKILSFLISSFVAGLGGAFYVHFWEILLPSVVLSLRMSIELIIASVVGGMGTIIGPIIGSYFLVAGQAGIKEWAGNYQILNFLEDWSTIIFLSCLIMLIFMARGGIVSMIRRISQGVFSD